MEEQSRPEGVADEHASAPQVPMPADVPADASAALPGEPISAPALGEPSEQADLRFHPWQVMSPLAPESPPVLERADEGNSTPATPEVAPDGDGAADGDTLSGPQDTGALLADQDFASLPGDQGVPAQHDDSPDARDQLGEGTGAAAASELAAPTSAREPALETPLAGLPMEELEMVSPAGGSVTAATDHTGDHTGDHTADGEQAAIVSNAGDEAAVLGAEVQPPQSVEDPPPLTREQVLEPPALAAVVPLAAMASASREQAPDAPPIFTAPTVPPSEPLARHAHGLPAIPVDPSAETVPLNARTDEVMLVGRAYPGYPGYAGSPLGSEPSGQAGSLRQPLSRDAIVRFLTAAWGTIVLAAVLGLLLTADEWATGLAAAAIAGLVVSAVYLVGTLVRVAAGARKGSTLRLGLTAALLFGVLGGAGLFASGSLHRVQAGVLASVGDFGGAVREYRLAGYEPPNADLASAYDGRGNDQLRQRDYAGAASSFQAVIEAFPQTSVAPDAARGLLAAYPGWLASDRTDLPFAEMLRDLETVSQASYCDSTCSATAATLTAQVYLQYGVALNQQGKYPQAIAQFQSVTSLYPTSTYAPQAHEDAAVTYYTYGQQQRYGKTCTNAVATFQTLASGYGDTPEGAAAKAALAAHVQVSGQLTGYPKNPVPVVYLSKTVRSNTYFSDDYSAKLDATGKFTFQSVAPGSYNLSAAVPNGSGVYWVDPNTRSPYSISVGPLCTLTLQSYPYS